MAADPSPCAKPTLPIFTSTKARTFAYVITFSFLLCTAFLVFNPSGYSYNFFTYRSQLSSIFSHFFPNPPSSQNPIYNSSGNYSEKGFFGSLNTSQHFNGVGASVSQFPSENFLCNIYDGRWVFDDSYPLYESGSCPYIDEAFNCGANGRVARGYEKFRWQPRDCNIPR